VSCHVKGKIWNAKQTSFLIEFKCFKANLRLKSGGKLHRKTVPKLPLPMHFSFLKLVKSSGVSRLFTRSGSFISKCLDCCSMWFGFFEKHFLIKAINATMRNTKINIESSPIVIEEFDSSIEIIIELHSGITFFLAFKKKSKWIYLFFILKLCLSFWYVLLNYLLNYEERRLTFFINKFSILYWKR